MWELFEIALDYSKNPTKDNREYLAKYFDIVINQKGIGNSKIKWGEFYKKSIMAISWDEIGDLNKYSNKNEMVERFHEVNNRKSSYSNTVLATWQFENEIKPGDVIL